MVKLMIQVTPPRPGDRSAIMSTQEWIQHPERRSALKRHSSITFTPQKQKKLRYEPRDEGTESILEYHAKNEASHQDRDVIGVTYPFDEILEESKKRNNDLKQIPGLKDQIAELNAKDQARDAQMEAFKVQFTAEMSEFKAKVAALDAKDKAQDGARLKMFLANLIVKLIDKVSVIQGRPLPEGSNDNAHSTNRYQAFATNMPNTKKSQRKWEQDTCLDHKYIKTVKNLAKYQKQRNKAAHETEYEFARLLLSDRYRDQHAHHHYGPVFKFVYNISVEDAAKVEREEDFEGKDEVNSDDE